MSLGESRSDAALPALSFALHARRTLAIALPAMAARVGELSMTAVDAVMTGRHDAAELALYGLGRQPWIFLFLIGLGLLAGVSILTAQADGAGERHRCGAIWRRGLLHALMIAATVMVLCQFGTGFLLLTGQAPELAAGAGEVIRAFGWGMPAVLVYVATTFFMEGLSRPVPDMVIMIGANGLNVLFNWILIGGNWGAPALGAVGAALSTAAVYWVAAIVFVAYVTISRRAERARERRHAVNSAEIGRKLWRIGRPMSLSFALDSSSYLALTLLAGLLGAQAVAAHQAGMSLLNLVFMMTIGIGVATAVRVGNAVGRQDPGNLRRAAWTGVALATVSMIVMALLLVVLRREFAALFTGDAETNAITSACLLVAAAYLVFEGCQMVLKMALRGIGDIWVPFGIALCAFWLAGIPCSLTFALVLDWGAPGIYGGIGVAMVISAMGNLLRFRAVSRRSIARL